MKSYATNTTYIKLGRDFKMYVMTFIKRCPVLYNYNHLTMKNLFKMTVFTSVILLQILIVMCIATDSVSVLKYTEDSNCQNTVARVPIESESTITEFTFCGKYAFKYLREMSLFEFEGLESRVSFVDFRKRYGFVNVFGLSYMFLLGSMRINPDQWMQLCLSFSSTKLQVR